MPLTDVVSQLVRAQMGSSVDTNVKDEELDRHVADLLLQEARARDSRLVAGSSSRAWDDHSPSAGPSKKPNKRFLTNMIRNVDEHNQMLLKAEEQAQRKRDEQEVERVRQWRRHNGYHHQRYQDEDDEHRSSSRRRRSRSPSYSRHRDDDDDDDRHHRHRHHRHRDRSSDRQGRPEASSSGSRQHDHEDKGGPPLPSGPKPPSPPPGPPPSKMDKYFDKAYDPALDVSIDDLTQPNGLIAEGAFDEWNTMLETVRVRKRAKDEEKRRHKRERQDRSKSDHRGSKKDRAADKLEEYEKNVENGLKAMGAYVRKPREWDQGKRISDLA